MSDCPICFEEGKEIIHLPCFHTICNICYIRLYDNAFLPKCPFCKHPLHINTQEELDLYNANNNQPERSNEDILHIMRNVFTRYNLLYTLVQENAAEQFIADQDNNNYANDIVNQYNNDIINQENDNDIINENHQENDNNIIHQENNNNIIHQENNNDIINENHQENVEIINIPELVELDDEQIIEMVNTVNHINNILF